MKEISVARVPEEIQRLHKADAPAVRCIMAPGGVHRTAPSRRPASGCLFESPTSGYFCHFLSHSNLLSGKIRGWRPGFISPKCQFSPPHLLFSLPVNRLPRVSSGSNGANICDGEGEASLAGGGQEQPLENLRQLHPPRQPVEQIRIRSVFFPFLVS